METAALKQGRKVCSKLEAKIKELESELDQEQRRLTDTTKSLRKSERRIKELEFQVIYMKLANPLVSVTSCKPFMLSGPGETSPVCKI